MPKKSRTPPPPKPVQSPKRRYEPTAGGGWSRRSLAVAAAALAAVGVAVGLSVALAGGGGSGGSAQKLAAAGCKFKTYAEQGASHVESLDAKITYKSFPPTSGPHHFQPALWGSYPSPISQVQGVHNLEHGGVIIQYGSRVPRATVEELTAFYDSSPNGLLMAPLPQLESKIALTAWTHLELCSRFDEAAFKAFRDAYRGKGPERVPVAVLKPGT